MLSTFLNTFFRLPLSNRSMIYLMWIYSLGGVITGVFLNIYVFKIHSSIEDLIIYNLVFYTASFAWFWLLGWLMSLLIANIRNMYYISYVLFIVAYYVLLAFDGTLSAVYIFGILFGLGNGSFWNAVHTQELKNIENQNRDFYSSSISAGQNIISIVVPFVVAFIFYITDLYQMDGYWVLFETLPIVYLFSFIFIHHIDSYFPPKITRKDVSNFFDLKKYKFGHLYFLIRGISHGFVITTMPIITIMMLKNEVNIWLFQGILTLVSTFLIVYLSTRRMSTNRMLYFSWISTGLCLMYIFFWWQFHFVGFLIFSLLGLFLNPLFRISEHVYDLHLMDGIKTEESDFYPGMILREVILWTGRLISIVFLLFFLYVLQFDTEMIIRIWLFGAGISFLLGIGSIFCWEKYEKNSL